MAGANYMGGKRNAAKTRSKDVTRRIQKGFFNRQRMDILSKGLTGATIKTKALNSTGPGRRASGIELAHAKDRAHSPLQDRDPGSTLSRSDPSTPPESRKRPRSPSKVLEALDITDYLPDLAGLFSGHQTRSEAGIYSSPQSKQPHNDIVPPLFHNKQAFPHSKYRPPAPRYRLKKYSSGPTSGSYTGSDHYSNSHSSEVSRPHHETHITPNEDFFGHDCEYTRAEEVDYPRVRDFLGVNESPLPECLVISSARRDSLPCSPIASEGGGSPKAYLSDLYLNPQSSSPLGPWESEHSQPLEANQCSAKQDVSSRSTTQDLLWPPDHLFGKRDPWHSLGVILGLTPDSAMSSDSEAGNSKLAGELDALSQGCDKEKTDPADVGTSSLSGLPPATPSASSPHRLSRGNPLKALEGAWDWELMEGSAVHDCDIITSPPDKVFLEPQWTGGLADDHQACAGSALPLGFPPIMNTHMPLCYSAMDVRATFQPLPEVDGIFYGPCLFDEVDESDHED